MRRLVKRLRQRRCRYRRHRPVHTRQLTPAGDTERLTLKTRTYMYPIGVPFFSFFHVSSAYASVVVCCSDHIVQFLL